MTARETLDPKNKGNGKLAVLIVMGCIVLLLAAATFMRNMIWLSDLTLWQDVVSKSPGKARAHYAVGFFYQNKEKFAESIR